MSDVVERFLRYVQVPSSSDSEAGEGGTPSTPEQHDMARLLERELLELGLEDVRRDGHAYVTASLPASPQACDLPALGLIAHVDTVPGVPGGPVRPHVVRYEGGDLVVGAPGGRPVSVSPAECPQLDDLVGEDLICSDGTTLLGADDKAGVAGICALLARLVADPSLPHPALRVAFVPDEEIGHGAALLDLDAFGAAWAYTVDGNEVGEVSWETFSAAEATVTLRGVQTHPGAAKGVMVNATSLFREFDAALPAGERPELAEGREGFFHCLSVQGDDGCVRARYILRDFDDEVLAGRKKALGRAADAVRAAHPTARVEVEVRDQYRNMASALSGRMFLVDNALAACRDVGVEPVVRPVRGGTDGSQLSERGLPCPNLGTGGLCFHSVREFVPVRALELQVDMLERLVARFAVPQGA